MRSLGYGTILTQRDNEDGAFHPIYYASGKTTPVEGKYPSYELEVFAIIKSLKKFRVYLLGTQADANAGSSSARTRSFWDS